MKRITSIILVISLLLIIFGSKIPSSFTVDGNISPIAVKEVGSGWWITTKDGKEYFLDKDYRKDYSKYPEIGKNIAVMFLDKDKNIINGWKIE